MIEFGIIVAVITGLVQGVKKFIESRDFAPVVSIGLGILAGIGFVDGSIQEQIFYGVVMGLAASGLFDTSKVTGKKIKEAANKPKKSIKR